MSTERTERPGPRASAAQRARSVSIRNDRAGAPIGEESLSRFFADYVQSGRSLRHLLTHPRAVYRALVGLSRLPVVHVRTGLGGDSTAIRSALRRPLRLLVLRGVNAVLEVPPTPEEYLAGRAKHGLRQNLKAGQKLGMASRTVDARDDRLALLRYVNNYERVNPVLEFRNTAPDNDDMLSMGVWVLTQAADGTPLLLAVAAVDGPVAVLRYYRTLSDNEEASAARFFTMPFLVDRLRDVGVTHLAETARPQWLPNGLRQFQRKVGFRLVRLRLVP